jgi:hypothetical protein
MKASLVYAKLQKSLSSEIPEPHGLSQPMICSRDGKYYLAVFAYKFTMADIRKGKVEQPFIWYLLDLSTGERLEGNPWTFSKSKKKCDIHSVNRTASLIYYKDAYELLDRVRSDIENTGILNKDMYAEYMKMILDCVSGDFVPLYNYLSVEYGSLSNVI